MNTKSVDKTGKKVVSIDPVSFMSFIIEMKFNDMVLAKGTAFFAKYKGKILLFTNKHNVTGRDIHTGNPLSKECAIPNKLSILLPLATKGGNNRLVTNGFQWFTVNLCDGNEMPKWIEHSDDRVDAVGIPFCPSEVQVSEVAFDITHSWHVGEVASKVSIVGYPFGLSTDNFPIWSSGYIASEPNIDVDDLPLMYIDARTRQGQSGSPVMQRIRTTDSIPKNGKRYSPNSDHTFLLGIYSGRVNPESDIGRVWKTRALIEIFEKFGHNLQASES
ncbi:trypsin-like peptidase domain-containing protein [Vibrio vulnificus]|nr:trypsin-like peptidase domain-containing protein [Vibrio vulnificus]